MEPLEALAMRRFVGCLLLIVALLPLLTSQDQKRSNAAAPIAMVVLAGEHSQTPCDCSQPSCACPNQQPAKTTSVASPSKRIDNFSAPSSEGIAVGPLALALLLGLIVFARFRL